MSSRSVTKTRAGAVKWSSQKVDIDFKVVGLFFKTTLPGMIKIRTEQKSVDKYGKSLGSYSSGYKRQRQKMGERTDRVYLRLTGGLMDSIAGRDMEIKGNSVTVRIGAGANPAKVVRPPADGKTGRWEIDTGKIGPRYNQILYWLGPGAKGKKRDILGFTRKEIKKIAKMIEGKKGILKKAARKR